MQAYNPEHWGLTPSQSTGSYSSTYQYNPYQRTAFFSSPEATAYQGTNPYAAYTSKVGGAANTVGANVMAQGPWTGRYEARTGDPEVGQYMAGTLGSQRNAVNDYVRRAAGAGVAASRGGYGVQGGAPAGAQLQQQAITGLAGGASDRYTAAMAYNKALKDSMYNQWQGGAGLWSDLLNKELQGTQGGAGWAADIYNKRYGSWNADAASQDSWAALQQQMELEKQRRAWQLQDYERDSLGQRQAGAQQSWRDAEQAARQRGALASLNQSSVIPGLSNVYPNMITEQNYSKTPQYGVYRGA